MFVKMISARTLFDIIEERRSMPDYYRLKSINDRTVRLTRDNACGLEAPLRNIGCGHSMTFRGLNKLAARVGWIFTVVPARRSGGG